MKDFTLYFTSFNGKGREVKFTLTIAAASERDACTVGHRMTEVMDWRLDNVDEAL